MKIKLVKQREGELLGPVDWSYDFLSHFGGYCGSDKADYCAKKVAQLRSLSEGTGWEATTDGGCPRFGWGRVLEVGMYDGWPYWRPVPSVLISGPFGGEWAAFSNITSIRHEPPS